MNYLISFLKDPYFMGFLFLTVGILFFIVTVIIFTIKRKISLDINNQIENLNNKNITIKYSDRILVTFSNFFENLSVKYGLNLPALLGLDDIWIKQIKKKGRKKSINKVLKYSPDKGLFAVMESVLENDKLQSIFMEWIDKSGEFMVLRKIALSGNGEQFDGNKALQLFKNRVDEINEMLGDFNWKSRYFAINILIYHNGDRSKSAVWESFNDPSVFVRISSVKLFITENRNKLYNILKLLLFNDPSFQVRKAARLRIASDFQDLYNIAPFELNISQQLHLIELMNPESKQDENIAIEFMKTKNKELELYASRFLSKNGTLQRLFQSSDPGYAKGFEDTYSILKIAISVDCTDFLDLSKSDISTGALLLASRILLTNGNRNIITILMNKVISIPQEKRDIHPFKEIYENSILSACKRGTDEALELLNSEIIERKYDSLFQKWILDKLPKNRENIFAPTLIGFLKDSNYYSSVELRKALINLPVSSILSEIIDILKEDNGKWDIDIRMEALKVLGAINLPHCTQYILENLYILPLEEAKKYSVLLVKNDTSAFRTKVKNILSFGDASSISHLIAALPENECKTFLPEIKNSLHDSNPEVRISAVWALSDYNKGEFLTSCFDLLRDPVECVRMEVGNTLAALGDSNSLAVLQQTLFDKNESLAVKNAVLHGLSVSKSTGVLDILLLKLEEDIELLDETILTLSKKDSQKELIKVLNFMEKTSPSAKQNIIKAIKIMGDKAEIIIEELLFSDNKILHNQAVSILEDSGIVDLRIRQLAHRDLNIRRKAAEFLMKTGTKKAFRGIILAAKDPDTEVRIQVVKALDHLNSSEGFSLLEELKNDPDKRIKKYTLWALERYEAKKLI